MSGLYTMKRGWMEHHLFTGEPYTRAQAWEWMIGEAAWKETKRFVGGSTVSVRRAQFTHSIRFMAEKWGWTKSKVERFVSRLKTETMIETQNETGQLVITICNYDEYQLEPEFSGQQSGQERGRQRDSSETKKNKVNKEIKEDIHTREVSDFQKIYEVGCDLYPNLAPADTSPVRQWVANGCSPELDAIPEIKRHAGKNINSWGYFTNAVAQAHQTRTSPMPQVPIRASPWIETAEQREEKRKRIIESLGNDTPERTGTNH